MFYDPGKVPVPSFLTDNAETREDSPNTTRAARIDQAWRSSSRSLKEAGLYDRHDVFTADHGMAFSGGKTTVYEPGCASRSSSQPV
ncbi:MAG: hypothetical protein R3F11_18115 [Verrucomicrobiales bacterium]